MPIIINFDHNLINKHKKNTYLRMHLKFTHWLIFLHFMTIVDAKGDYIIFAYCGLKCFSVALLLSSKLEVSAFYQYNDK